MTYADLREQILLALDISPDTTNDDTVDLVNLRMKQVVTKVVTDTGCVDLLTEKMKNVNSSTTSIPLNASGFLCTDLAEVFAVSVDDKTTATRNDLVWTPCSRELWILSQSVTYGVERPALSWTQDGNGDFYLSEWPQGSATWDVYLHYYRQIAAITDLGEPEIPNNYQQAIVVGGVVMGFPHRFVGDRQMTLAVYQQEYTEALNALLKSRKVRSQDIQVKTRNTVNSTSGVNWGSWQSS